MNKEQEMVGLLVDRHETSLMIKAIKAQIERLQKRLYAPAELRELEAELECERRLWLDLDYKIQAMRWGGEVQPNEDTL